MSSVADIHIETTRLLLRLPQRADFDPYAELHADEEAARYIGGAMPRAAAWRKFLQMPGAWAMQGYAMFSVVDKASGEWLGQCGPWQPEGWPGTEVGWALRRSAWGKGYAQEAAIATIDWAFNQLGWTEVIHSINTENLASRARTAPWLAYPASGEPAAAVRDDRRRCMGAESRGMARATQWSKPPSGG